MFPDVLCANVLFTNVELVVGGRTFKRRGLVFVGICIAISYNWLNCGRKEAHQDSERSTGKLLKTQGEATQRISESV